MALVILAVIWLMLFYASPTLAITPQLDYPIIQGFDIAKQIRTGNITFTQVALFAYNLLIIIGGVVAFIGLVMAGTKWLSAAANPGAISEAKAQVVAALVGLVILLGSWIMLHTIDPQLVLFYPFGTKADVDDIDTLTEQPLTDGITFDTDSTDPQLEKLKMPAGQLTSILDTRRFPLASGGTVNISGENAQTPRITHIRFNQPPDPRPFLSVLTSGYLVPIYNYGAACFEQPGFIGSVRIEFNPTTVSPLGLIQSPWLVFEIPQSSGPNKPCRSILVFRLPHYFYTLENPAIDRIIFYQLPFPDREGKSPSGARIINGFCLKVNSADPPENCDLRHSGVLQWPYPASTWPYAKDLYTPGYDAAGNFVINWYPLSMEIITDKPGKFLIFLFRNFIAGTSHWLLGDAYHFDADVPDFSNFRDERLYWLNLSNPQSEPHSYMIFQVEKIF